MSDIALLMTGVLKTKQPSPPDLLKQPLVQLENGVKKPTWGQLSHINSNAQITPPEFVQPDGTLSTTPPVSTKENILKNIKKKTLYKSTIRLAKYKVLATVATGTTAMSSRGRLSNPAVMLVADREVIKGFQARDEIVSTIRKEITHPLPTLNFGDSGVSVRVLQRLLISNGYAVRIDGTFGALTEAAVKAFQNRRNVFPDGVVGERTWRELAK